MVHIPPASSGSGRTADLVNQAQNQNQSKEVQQKPVELAVADNLPADGLVKGPTGKPSIVAKRGGATSPENLQEGGTRTGAGLGGSKGISSRTSTSPSLMDPEVASLVSSPEAERAGQSLGLDVAFDRPLDSSDLELYQLLDAYYGAEPERIEVAQAAWDRSFDRFA
jgi:hypothetical protein